MTTPLIFNSNQLIALLGKGSPIAFPTDTVPALATYPEHALNLWEIKNRPKHKPFILMGSSTKELLKYVLDEAFNDASQLATAYWPGALTMVLPAKRDIVAKLNPNGGSSIGMRVPKCNLALKFLRESGPLATTSANLSGFEPLIKPEEIALSFPDLPLLGPMPWPKPSGLASTVIKWSSKGKWQLLRRGAVMPLEIE